LKMHEIQRLELHTTIEGQIGGVEDKIDTIMKAVGALATETVDNTNFIAKLKKYWIRITFTATGVGLALGGVYYVIQFLQSHGFVFYVEKAVP